jgi:hypothetical protein
MGRTCASHTTHSCQPATQIQIPLPRPETSAQALEADGPADHEVRGRVTSMVRGSGLKRCLIWTRRVVPGMRLWAGMYTVWVVELAGGPVLDRSGRGPCQGRCFSALAPFEVQLLGRDRFARRSPSGSTPRLSLLKMSSKTCLAKGSFRMSRSTSSCLAEKPPEGFPPRLNLASSSWRMVSALKRRVPEGSGSRFFLSST